MQQISVDTPTLVTMAIFFTLDDLCFAGFCSSSFAEVEAMLNDVVVLP